MAFGAAQAADSSTVTHDPSESGLGLDLGGRATFHFVFDVSNGGGLDVDVNGNANLYYIERPSSRDEARAAWTKLAGSRCRLRRRHRLVLLLDELGRNRLRVRFLLRRHDEGGPAGGRTPSRVAVFAV